MFSNRPTNIHTHMLQNSSTRLLHNLGAIRPGIVVRISSFVLPFEVIACRYFEDVTYRAGVDMDELRRGDKAAAGTFTFCSSMTVSVDSVA